MNFKGYLERKKTSFVENSLTIVVLYFLLPFWAEVLSQICLDSINSFRLNKTAFFENLLLSRNKSKHYLIHKFCRKRILENYVLRALEKQTYFMYLNSNLDIQIYAQIHENPEHNLLKFWSYDT